MTARYRAAARCIALQVCAAALVGWAAAAGAADVGSARQAVTAQNAGVRAFEEGRYAEAIERLQEAYALNPQPDLLYQIGEARYRLGQLDVAKSCLFAFLKEDPKSLLANKAFELLTRIENEAKGTTAAVACVSPAAPRPQDRATGATPVIQVQQPGDGSKSLAGSPGLDQGKGPPSVTSKRGRQRTWTWVAAGGAAVALGAGGVYALKTNSSGSSSDANMANILFGVGGALAIVSATFFFLEF